jgi:hypothetical protein
MVVAALKGFRKAREFERGVSMEMESEVLEREREEGFGGYGNCHCVATKLRLYHCH